MVRKSRSKQRSFQELADFCAHIGPEDGIHPKYLKRQAAGRGDRRGMLRLAREVERCLQMALLDARGDPVLAELTIAHVEPSRDGGQLHVYVVPCNPQAPPPRAVAEQALAAAASWLRAEVAAAIVRRRAPILLFRLVPGEVQS